MEEKATSVDKLIRSVGCIGVAAVATGLSLALKNTETAPALVENMTQLSSDGVNTLANTLGYGAIVGYGAGALGTAYYSLKSVKEAIFG
ncbi:hypothetical protein ACFLZB_01115 [Nanoarchaeota archaeon]